MLKTTESLAIPPIDISVGEAVQACRTYLAGGEPMMKAEGMAFIGAREDPAFVYDLSEPRTHMLGEVRTDGIAGSILQDAVATVHWPDAAAWAPVEAVRRLASRLGRLPTDLDEPARVSFAPAADPTDYVCWSEPEFPRVVQAPRRNKAAERQTTTAVRPPSSAEDVPETKLSRRIRAIANTITALGFVMLGVSGVSAAEHVKVVVDDERTVASLEYHAPEVAGVAGQLAMLEQIDETSAEAGAAFRDTLVLFGITLVSGAATRADRLRLSNRRQSA